MKKILIAVLLVAFSVPAFAFDIALPGEGNKLNLYGTIRAMAWYQNTNLNGASNPTTNDNQFVYAAQSNSRIGFNLTAGNIFGTMEMAYSPDGGGGGATANESTFRLLFAGYKFSNGLAVSLGRMATIAETQLAYDNLYATDGGMSGFGAMQVHRTPMLKFSMMGIDLAIVTPGYINGNYAATRGAILKLDGVEQVANPGTANIATAVSQNLLPSFEAAYNLNFSPITGKVFVNYAGINTKATANFGAGSFSQRELVSSFTAGLVLKGKFDALAVALSGFYSYNGNLTGKVRWGTTNPDANYASFNDLKSADIATGKVTDAFNGLIGTNAVGVALSVGYDITPEFNVTLGGGYQTIFSDSYRTGKSSKETYSLDSFGAYIVAPYKLAANFMIIPTVGYYANYKSGLKDATNKSIDTSGTGILIAGAQLRVNF